MTKMKTMTLSSPLQVVKDSKQSGGVGVYLPPVFLTNSILDIETYRQIIPDADERADDTAIEKSHIPPSITQRGPLKRTSDQGDKLGAPSNKKRKTGGGTRVTYMDGGQPTKTVVAQTGRTFTGFLGSNI